MIVYFISFVYPPLARSEPKRVSCFQSSLLAPSRDAFIRVEIKISGLVCARLRFRFLGEMKRGEVIEGKVTGVWKELVLSAIPSKLLLVLALDKSSLG
jgi:hypothetical protein